MTPFSFMRMRARRRSGGVAIMTAIFLLVAVAGIAVAVVSLTTAQQDASAKDMQGQRAYQAARAGLEWGLYVAQRSATPATPGPSLCAQAASFALPGSTFTGFRVTVHCDAGDAASNHIRITSTACNQPDGAGNCPNNAPGADYVQRVVTAQL